jgi:hypothetical protein
MSFQVTNTPGFVVLVEMSETWDRTGAIPHSTSVDGHRMMKIPGDVKASIHNKAECMRSFRKQRALPRSDEALP